MPRHNDQSVEVAIIGAGISGLYTAWRLATSENGIDPKRITVFEATERIGGRLWSHKMAKGTSTPVELGGMFFSDCQPLVHDLCTGAFDLETHPVHPSPQFAYVRGQRFRIGELPTLESIPYNLAPEERGITYHEIMFHSLRRILPRLDEFWPLDPEGKFRETTQYLRRLKIDDTPLHQWGFRNLIDQVTSNEAQLCIQDMVGIRSFLGNWNACDAILSMLSNLPGNWYKLPYGYQRLTDVMADTLSNLGVQIKTNCRLENIQDGHDPGQLNLRFSTQDRYFQLIAQRAVLTIPKTSLNNLDPQSNIFSDQRLRESLDAVSPIPTCKVFLSFDSPWWEDVEFGPGQVDFGTLAKSHTDLPLRQCYYHDCNGAENRSILMTAFCDADAMQFWEILAEQSDGNSSGVLSPLSGNGIQYIRRQLAEMHDIEVPEPREVLFVNWRNDVYGGGWHLWEPGWRSEQVMNYMQQPDPSRPVHICGEAFSAYQGWVEGSLSSAEAMLQAKFGLSTPEWLTSENSLVPYDAS